jgi:hypothetical protein
MRRLVRARLPAVSFLLICILYAGSQTRAAAAVFRDRAAFNAAAQNLHTIDFEGERREVSGSGAYDVDGIRFVSAFGLTVAPDFGTTNTKLHAHTIGEITFMTVYLPPGTTAVGFDQFEKPMTISTSTGESVTMIASDNSTFVGFVSDQPVQTLTVMLDFPEPTPNAVLDDFSFGQRRAGNEPPTPLLLTDATTGRAAAFDSVALTSEPFGVATPRTRNLAEDGLTRVTLLVVGVRLDAPGEAAHVSASAVDAQQRAFDLPVEAVGGAKNLSWLAQVTVRLPASLAGAGDVTVSVTVRGAQSNGVTLRVE